MNVYEHRFSASTLPGQGELWNKEHEFALRQALCARRAAGCKDAPFAEQLALARPGVFSAIQANSGRTEKEAVHYKGRLSRHASLADFARLAANLCIVVTA